jgi:hypothetical protein
MPWRPIGLWEVEALTFSRQSADKWWWGFQPYVPVALYPLGIFLMLISVRGWVEHRAIAWLEGLGKLEIPVTAKRNSGRKSKSTGRDRRTLRRIVSKSHRTTAAQVTAELNIHLEDPVSTNNFWRELHKSDIHFRAATANLWLLKVMLRCVNDEVTTIKPGRKATGSARVI